MGILSKEGNPYEIAPGIVFSFPCFSFGKGDVEIIWQFAGRLAPLLVATIRREQSAGRLRADLDPRLVALSTIGLIVFPYVAMPVASRVFGVTADDPGVERLAAHTATVMLEGLAARGAT